VNKKVEAKDLIEDKEYFHLKYGRIVYKHPLGSIEGMLYIFYAISLSETIEIKWDKLIEEVLFEKPIDLKAGMKFDGDKPRWGLLPEIAVNEIVKVLTYGAKKYNPGNWKYVEGRRWRYFDAMRRHLYAWKEEANFGRNRKFIFDKDSGLMHLAHAGCCLLFLIWIDIFPSDDDSIGIEKFINEDYDEHKTTE